ncbi:recombinase family protein [Anianabacter salinae]|uniref:recombinase family protein n=1 Tax=Anianabacter salinae TaxID=2851023 RepID=UPI00225E59BE|nr:recombinase family protein [Anianabacter salinae]MBV0914217.1 recombinase family protein [Anianabacter salinae]
MTRAAVYARYSSSMQRDASIEDQVRICQARALREGWDIVQTFSDVAISGATMQRPGLQSLLSHAESGRIDVVLAEALDRLSRDQADVATLFKRLSFHGVRIVTLAEGEVSELHVGLKGTMNQLFLKDLADKTRRGLRGRVEAGRSGGGNAYGYDVVRRIGENGEPVTGERCINPTEAAIIQRIFRMFAEGQSPKAIARRLNSEGVPGPRGKLWRDTAIRGHRIRGTGFLNNELYIGRLVWNRLRYVKDPATGRRVSRRNPEAEWIITEVPELRIIDDALWARVKARQGEIDASAQVQGIRQSRFWERKRKTHLLSGLLTCGSCGGGFAAVGKDYVACSAARKLGTCDQRRSFKRGVLERAVLDLLKERLMQPDAVAEFVAAFNAGINSERGKETAARAGLEKERAALERKLDGLYDAIADGLRTDGLKERLTALEARKTELDRAFAAPPPSPVRLHPKLSELYRKKVAALATSLEDPEVRTPALEIIRSLIDRVTVREAQGGAVLLELEGALTAMIETAQAGALVGVDPGSVEVVAGAGFEPAAFRL